MSAGFVIEWTPELRRQQREKRRRDSFGSVTWPANKPRRVRPAEPRERTKVKAICKRCGIEREVDSRRPAPLCNDCRAVLSKEERRAWAS